MFRRKHIKTRPHSHISIAYPAFTHRLGLNRLGFHIPASLVSDIDFVCARRSNLSVGLRQSIHHNTIITHSTSWTWISSLAIRDSGGTCALKVVQSQSTCRPCEIRATIWISDLGTPIRAVKWIFAYLCLGCSGYGRPVKCSAHYFVYGVMPYVCALLCIFVCATCLKDIGLTELKLTVLVELQYNKQNTKCDAMSGLEVCWIHKNIMEIG